MSGRGHERPDRITPTASIRPAALGSRRFARSGRPQAPRLRRFLARALSRGARRASRTRTRRTRDEPSALARPRRRLHIDRQFPDRRLAVAAARRERSCAASSSATATADATSRTSTFRSGRRPCCFPVFAGLSRSRRPRISSDPQRHVLHDIDKPERYILGGCVEDLWVAVSVLSVLYPGLGRTDRLRRRQLRRRRRRARDGVRQAHRSRASRPADLRQHAVLADPAQRRQRPRRADLPEGPSGVREKP